MLLGVSCLLFLVMMTTMKSSLGSIEDNPSPVVKVSRGLVWTLATSEYTANTLFPSFTFVLHAERKRVSVSSCERKATLASRETVVAMVTVVTLR